MGMVSEWEFTKKGNKTKAEVTRTFVDEELSEEDRKELEELFVYLIDLIVTDKHWGKM